MNTSKYTQQQSFPIIFTPQETKIFDRFKNPNPEGDPESGQYYWYNNSIEDFLKSIGKPSGESEQKRIISTFSKNPSTSKLSKTDVILFLHSEHPKLPSTYGGRKKRRTKKRRTIRSFKRGKRKSRR